MIQKRWCVIAHRTGRNMGCYRTRKQAERRLWQIRRFKRKKI